MKKLVILSLLALVIAGLISSCSKSSDPAPDSPIVGQFDIQRYVFTDFSGNYTVYNGFADSTATGIKSALGIITDTYIFKNDNTYSNSFTSLTSSGGTNNGSETGSWSLASSQVTLTPTPQSGQTSQPYSYSFNGTNELYTGKIAVSDTITDPKTKVDQLTKFNLYWVYRKKK